MPDKIFRVLKKAKNNQNKALSFILCQIYLLLLSFSAVYFSFRINKSIEISTLLFLWQHSGIFFLSFFIIFTICEILYLLTFYLYAPLFTVYPVAVIFSYVNYIKVSLRNETFVFTDLLLLKESGNIAGNYDVRLTGDVYFIVLFFIFLTISALFIKRNKTALIPRITVPVAGIILSAIFINFSVIAENSILDTIYLSSSWDLKKEYAENGFILGFITSFKRSLFFAPANYSYNTVLSSAEALGGYESGMNGELPEELPNVIVIMSESYWDCYDNLTGIIYNKDPMESVRGIMSVHGSGKLLSPVFGGGTSNVEYEFLTGKSIMFYPANSMVHQQYITKKQWSLAWYFQDLGYSTTAIHPYYHWFWKRSTVFPLLGFENIYFDADMKYQDRTGNFISDMSLTKEIIDKYELLSDSGNVPVFNFSISMQNHGGYYAGIYQDTEIKLTVKNGDANDIACEVFGEGMRYASEAFVALTEYFGDVERPTYILMFGDHAPTLANIKELYALDENAEMYGQDLINQYITPVVVWSNTGKKFELGTQSVPMLTESLFNITELPKPPYIKLLSNIKKITPGFTSLYYLDRNGNVTQDEDIRQQIYEISENLRYCQYDATSGKNYVINEFAP